MRACRFRASHAVLTVLLASQGCAVRPQPDATPVLDNSSVAGRVGFDFLPDPNDAGPSLSDDQWFKGPVPVHAPLPEYPQQALDRVAPPVTLVIRIIVEEDGTVKEVLASPLDKSAEGDDHELFWTAIGEAVRRWRFEPAIINTLIKAPAPDRDPNFYYRMSVEAKVVRAYMDLRFKFEVVDGRGRVQLGSNP